MEDESVPCEATRLKMNLFEEQSTTRQFPRMMLKLIETGGLGHFGEALAEKVGEGKRAAPVLFLFSFLFFATSFRFVADAEHISFLFLSTHDRWKL